MPSSGSITAVSEVQIDPAHVFLNAQVTPDLHGKFFVTGFWHGRKSGAVLKLDVQGNINWEYRSEDRNSVSRSNAPIIVTGAVPLIDGGALVCGNTTRDEHVVGTLVRLSSDGKVVKANELVPADEKSFSLRGIKSCGHWGNGIYGLVFPEFYEFLLAKKKRI